MEYHSPSSVEQVADRLESAAAELFSVHDVTLGLPGQPEVIRLRGTLQVPPERAYSELAPRFRQEGYTLYLRRDRQLGLDVLLAIPGVAPEPRPSRVWVNAVLYVLTVFSTLLAGVFFWSDKVPANADVMWILTHFWIGWPFALSLMVILTGHELGHYFTSRYFKVPATLPYFLPLPPPISPLGTLGAVIVMKGQTVNRRQMLAIGAAGPLTGLILAVPILIIGLALSTVKAITPLQPGYSVLYEGNSVLYLLLKLTLFGKILPGSGIPPASLFQALREAGAALFGFFSLNSGYDVFISPVAAAGWTGLLVTALNLLPIGQLDGGHILYSLVGQRAKILYWPILGLSLLMGLVLWNGWLLWAFLIFVFGRSHPDPLDDVTRLSPAGKALAVAMLIVFVLTFTPIPLRIITAPAATQPTGQSVGGCLAVAGLVTTASWLLSRRRTRPHHRDTEGTESFR